ncbi:MAG TPA: DUF4261 domain-containing protein [Puia sp.]
MGNFFGLFKNKKKQELRLANLPELLNAKLLFVGKPVIDTVRVLEELRKRFDNVESSNDDKVLLFFFPDFKVALKDATIPAQCSVFIPNDDSPGVEIAERALQQNWHWKGASEAAANCKYEILITDLMTSAMDYKKRVDLFMNFLIAILKAMNPQVIYMVGAEKLIEPATLIKASENGEALFGLINVRLFKVSNGDNREMFMDTVGLSFLGLPDFQIRFTALNENEVAERLWDYAYYVFEKGDVINNGNTVAGIGPDAKWKCMRQPSLAKPERGVITITL